MLAGLAAEVPGRELAVAANRISDAYRDNAGLPVVTRVETLAYGATRLPATHAATRSALTETKRRLARSLVPRRHLDLATGCGAAIIAARETWPAITTSRGIDRSEAMLELAGELCPDAALEPGDLESFDAGGQQFDLVTMSYAVGELAAGDADALVGRAWAACAGVLVIVEPGTPRGFATVCRERDLLVGLGATVVAPCPHDDTCPMTAGDWCHFSVRLDRTVLHRRLKGGSLGFEDEKFSYVACARPQFAVSGDWSRILRHPRRHKGRVDLVLCGPDGLVSQTIGRSNSRYTTLSRLDWGDVVEAPSPTGAQPAGSVITVAPDGSAKSPRGALPE